VSIDAEVARALLHAVLPGLSEELPSHDAGISLGIRMQLNHGWINQQQVLV
jgi:hypothetical protein